MLKNSTRKKQKQWMWRDIDTDQVAGLRFFSQWNEGANALHYVQNQLYAVSVTRFIDGTARLTIHDDARRHNWAHYQRIKNELLGHSWEGIELYPGTVRLVDEADLYHMWCSPTAFKLGWDEGGTFTAKGTFYDPDISSFLHESALARKSSPTPK